MIDLAPMISQLITEYGSEGGDVDPSDLIVNVENDAVKFRVIIQFLGGEEGERRHHS